MKVSAAGLGCGNFGGVGSAAQFFGMGESEEQAFALMDRAVELGINFFDTADAYGGGRSEAMIGKWLVRKGSAIRDRLVISSKVFYPVGEAGPDQGGLSRRHIMSAIESSLKRLGLDHLDMYLIHEPDPMTSLEETLSALDDLIRQGKVRYIGAANMPAALMKRALWLSDVHGWHRFEWVQNSFSLLDRADEGEMMALCDDQQLGYTPFGPLGGGLLTGKYRFGHAYPDGSRMTLRPEPYMKWWTEETFERLERFRGDADSRGVTMAGLALAWVMHHPLVTAPILGPRGPAHFDPLLEAMKLVLSNEEHRAISEIFGSR
jgi:aryl-alcohol dehydrogenase-like predicted oxidoreductase